MNFSETRPRLSGNKRVAYENIIKDERRILVVGDIHAPFTNERYLDFCKETYAKYNCNQTIFIGDIIDNHYSSYHETDPNGVSGSDELLYAVEQIRMWSDAFPVADVTIGNHDRMIMRKAFTSSIPKEWIKSYNEVLGVNWNWTDRVVYDNVQYIHGEGGTAHSKCRADLMSTVQGHLHSQAYVKWFMGQVEKIFGMQVGCGIDQDSYAMAYAKRGKRPAIGCGVVIGGHTAINVLMEK